MPRRIANGLTLLSAVVCLGSALLVGRSFVWHDEISVPLNESSHVEVLICEGLLFLARSPDSNSFSHISARTTPGIRTLIYDVVGRANGVPWVFGWGYVHVPNTVLLPLWLLPVLTAIPPVRWWRARRREGGRGFAVESAAEGG